jgi:hypothetical protein
MGTLPRSQEHLKSKFSMGWSLEENLFGFCKLDVPVRLNLGVKQETSLDKSKIVIVLVSQ